MIKYIFMTLNLILLLRCAPEVATSKAAPIACQNTPLPNGNASSSGNAQIGQPGPNYQMTGGKLTSLYPAVIFLVRREGNELHMCSGTFVGPNTIFTAAHCVDATTSGGVGILTGTSYNPQNLLNGYQSSIFAKQVFYANHPSAYTDTTKPANPDDQAGDFAIIITQSDNAAPAIAPIREYKPSLNSEFPAIVVGYGKDESGSVGKKRMGNTTLELYSFPGTTAQAFANAQSGTSVAEVAEGDSGGGVFIGTELVAVTTRSNNVSNPLWTPRVQETINKAKAAGAIIGQKINAPIAGASVYGDGQNPVASNHSTNCR